MISPKTREQIAHEYGFSTRTLSRRLADSGIRITHRKLLLPNEQKRIYMTLGWPPKVDKDNFAKIFVAVSDE